MNNRSKKEVNMGRHLGIDFSSIWVGFGSQVGSQNRAKIDQKRCRKNDIVRKGLLEGMFFFCCFLLFFIGFYVCLCRFI